jgi:hypothetical protein
MTVDDVTYRKHRIYALTRREFEDPFESLVLRVNVTDRDEALESCHAHNFARERRTGQHRPFKSGRTLDSRRA